MVMIDDLPEPDPADDPDPRAARSMEAFDRMPEAFRAFISNYPRTADGVALFRLLQYDCSGQVDQAIALVRELLPADQA